MPQDRDLPEDQRMQADIAGEPLTASVEEVLEAHEDAAQRASDELASEEAERRRVSRRKAEESRTALRHTRGERRLRPRRDESRSGDGRTPEGLEGLDPRLLVGGVLVGLILAGGMRRLILLGAVATAGWAVYRRVLAPARDPAVVLQ